MAPEGGRWKPAQPPPRNHSSNLEGSGRGGGFHTSPTFSAARESIAVISGSGSDNATTPEGGNAAESSSPESRGLHGLKTEARTRPVPEIVWPNPTRPERHG